MVIYVGAAVMYLIGKRLKKRHNILDDARQSLYNEVDYFLKTVNEKGTVFLGGDEPNLADLAVYGCISSIDGKFVCTVFELFKFLWVILLINLFRNAHF
jgi:microsomal prostaglandin-E synthase 2